MPRSIVTGRFTAEPITAAGFLRAAVPTVVGGLALASQLVDVPGAFRALFRREILQGTRPSPVRRDVRIDLGRRRNFRAPTSPEVMARLKRRRATRKTRVFRGRRLKPVRRRRKPVRRGKRRRGRVLPTRRSANTMSQAMFRALTGK